VGISVADAFDYVSNTDPCKRKVSDTSTGITKTETVIDEGATVFRLGVLDVFLMGMIYDSSSIIGRGVDTDVGQIDVKTRLNATNIDAVRYGLRGWTHFPDAQGNDIQFTTVDRIVQGRTYKAVTDECLSRLGIQLISELGQQIKTASEVGKAETKNSVTA
jgi:hypothetical protein